MQTLFVFWEILFWDIQKTEAAVLGGELTQLKRGNQST
jgi:hypothetical protein